MKNKVIKICKHTMFFIIANILASCALIICTPYNSLSFTHILIASSVGIAINWGKEHGATIIQLTTNKERQDALRFYEKLGFKATHEGMKLYLKAEEL